MAGGLVLLKYSLSKVYWTDVTFVNVSCFVSPRNGEHPLRLATIQNNTMQYNTIKLYYPLEEETCMQHL